MIQSELFLFVFFRVLKVLLVVWVILDLLERRYKRRSNTH